MKRLAASATDSPAPLERLRDAVGSVTRDDRRWLSAAAVVLITLGAVRRFRLIPHLHDWKERLGEAFNVARAFAETGTLADAFGRGEGPTAHLMPLQPLLAGTVYRVFGVLSPASDLILTGIATGFVLTAFWMLYRAFGELDAPPAGRLLALALLCLAPANTDLEVIWFRVWDGGMAIAAGALLLLTVLRADRAKRVSTGWFVALAGVAAVTFFISPPLGVAGYLCCVLLVVRRVEVRRWPAAAAIALAVLVVVLAPWTIRNAVVMGSPVVLRDNFGLELAQGNDPSLVDSRDSDGGAARVHLAIHPYVSRRAYAEMIAMGGEVAYSNVLKTRATTWIAAHPGDFARLTAHHLRQMLFPPPTMFGLFPGIDMKAVEVRLAIHWFVSLFGLAGIGYALAALDRRYRYAAIMGLVPMIPYLVVEPILRYRYLVFGVLTFFACDLLVRIAGSVIPAAAAQGRRAPPAA